MARIVSASIALIIFQIVYATKQHLAPQTFHQRDATTVPVCSCVAPSSAETAPICSCYQPTANSTQFQIQCIPACQASCVQSCVDLRQVLAACQQACDLTCSNTCREQQIQQSFEQRLQHEQQQVAQLKQQALARTAALNEQSYVVPSVQIPGDAQRPVQFTQPPVPQQLLQLPQQFPPQPEQLYQQPIQQPKSSQQPLPASQQQPITFASQDEMCMNLCMQECMRNLEQLSCQQICERRCNIQPSSAVMNPTNLQNVQPSQIQFQFVPQQTSEPVRQQVFQEANVQQQLVQAQIIPQPQYPSESSLPNSAILPAEQQQIGSGATYQPPIGSGVQAQGPNIGAGARPTQPSIGSGASASQAGIRTEVLPVVSQLETNMQSVSTGGASKPVCFEICMPLCDSQCISQQQAKNNTFLQEQLQYRPTPQQLQPQYPVGHQAPMQQNLLQQISDQYQPSNQLHAQNFPIQQSPTSYQPVQQPQPQLLQQQLQYPEQQNTQSEERPVAASVEQTKSNITLTVCVSLCMPACSPQCVQKVTSAPSFSPSTPKSSYQPTPYYDSATTTPAAPSSSIPASMQPVLMCIPFCMPVCSPECVQKNLQSSQQIQQPQQQQPPAIQQQVPSLESVIQYQPIPQSPFNPATQPNLSYQAAGGNPAMQHQPQQQQPLMQTEVGPQLFAPTQRPFSITSSPQIYQQRDQITVNLPLSLRQNPNCEPICRNSCQQQCVQQNRDPAQCSSSCAISCARSCAPNQGIAQQMQLTGQTQFFTPSPTPQLQLQNDASQQITQCLSQTSNLKCLCPVGFIICETSQHCCRRH